MDRRRFLVAGGAAAAAGINVLPGCAHSQASSNAIYTPQFLEDLFASNSEDSIVPRAGVRLSRDQYSTIVATLQRGIAKVAWPADDKCPDFAHLEQGASTAAFTATAKELQAVAEANGFQDDLGGDQRKALFGLRGCSVDPPMEGVSAAAISLTERSPDHWTQNCVIGVWDIASGLITAFNASTVTDAAYVYAQATKIEGANLMPTGLYAYQVGTHAWRSKTGLQPGAFRQATAWPVRRITEMPVLGDLVFDHGAVWDLPTKACGVRSATGNNIHAGWLDKWDGGIKFSSAGCQTLPGRYEPRGKTPAGAFSDFRVAAGLPLQPTLEETVGPDNTTQTVKTPEDGLRYRYMLVTGRDLRLASEGNAQKRIRYGSRGALAMEAQQRLKEMTASCLTPDGVFGMASVSALVQFQLDQNLTPDGMISPRVAEKLGIKL